MTPMVVLIILTVCGYLESAAVPFNPPSSEPMSFPTLPPIDAIGECSPWTILTEHRIDDWCYGEMFDGECRVIDWHATCERVDIPPTPPRTPVRRPPTTPSTKKDCVPWSDASIDRFGNWCFGTFYDDECTLISWDGLCADTLPPSTMSPPVQKLSTTVTQSPYTGNEKTSSNPASTPPTSLGTLPPNKNCEPWIDVTSGRVGNWCFGTYLDDDCQPVDWDGDCDSTTSHSISPSSTSTPSAVMSTSSTGEKSTVAQTSSGAASGPPTSFGTLPPHKNCEPWFDVTSGRVGDLCFGSYYDDDCQLVNWDENCDSTHTVTTAPTASYSTTQLNSPATGRQSNTVPRRRSKTVRHNLMEESQNLRTNLSEVLRELVARMNDKRRRK